MTTQLLHANRARGMSTFENRVHSLIQDGYHITFKSTRVTSDMWWACLRHHNGNRVTLYAYFAENRLVQRTNHIVTHEGALY